jgi:hypothetical protein
MQLALFTNDVFLSPTMRPRLDRIQTKELWLLIGEALTPLVDPLLSRMKHLKVFRPNSGIYDA